MTSGLWHSVLNIFWIFAIIQDAACTGMHEWLWMHVCISRSTGCVQHQLHMIANILRYSEHVLILSALCLPLKDVQWERPAQPAAVSTGSCERLWKCDSQIPTELSGWFHPPQLLPRCPVDASASHGVSFHPSPDSTFDGVCRCPRTDSPSNQWDIQQLLQPRESKS